MNFWNNPENDGLKMVLIAILVTGVGLFIYNSFQTDALGGRGQVFSSSAAGGGSMTNPGGGSGSTGAAGGGSTTNPGGGTGKGKGGGTGSDSPCGNNSSAVAMTATYVPGTSATSIAVNPPPPNRNVALGTFEISNPSQCPMNLTEVNFVSHPSIVVGPTYSIIQDIRLTDASTGTSFGAALPFTDPIDITGNLPFTSTTGVIVPAFGSVEFNLTANGQNVPPPAQFQIQLTEFSAINTVTSVIDHALYPSSLGSVMGPVVTFVR